jgi:hypothetical protein
MTRTARLLIENRDALQKEKSRVLKENSKMQQDEQDRDRRLLVENNKLKRENNVLQHEKNRLQDEKNKIEQSRSALLQEKKMMVKERAESQQTNVVCLAVMEELKQENSKLVQENSLHRELMARLRRRVECPVCQAVPRAFPVPQCPNGHCICSPCNLARRAVGLKDCPTCGARIPGEARSLLTTFIAKLF